MMTRLVRSLNILFSLHHSWAGRNPENTVKYGEKNKTALLENSTFMV